MKEENPIDGVDSSQLELYKNAQKLEEKNYGFFLEKAGEANDQTQKEILLKLADEEKSHCTILENIINFISQPVSCLEDAEWSRLDEDQVCSWNRYNKFSTLANRGILKTYNTRHYMPII